MAVSQFHLQTGKAEKSKVGGDDSHFVFGQEGSVRRCVVVMQQPVRLSPKFGAKYSHYKKSQWCAELAVWPSRTNSL
jgi:hypothetical protein